MQKPNSRLIRRLGLTFAGTLLFTSVLPGGHAWGVDPEAANAPGAPAIDATALTSAPVTVAGPIGKRAAAARAKAKNRDAKALAGVAMSRPAGEVVRPLAPRNFWELQINVCNGGSDDCFAGTASITEAANAIFQLQPDLVTVNEVCRADVTEELQAALTEAFPDDTTYAAFNAVRDRAAGAAARCDNGDEFGNAVIGRVPGDLFQGANGWSGRYASQDGGGREQTFVCVYAVGDHFGCATQLSGASDPVALEQCRALMFDHVPTIKETEAFTAGRTVVGGDFNLWVDEGDPEGAQRCVPNGYSLTSDGDVQHVLYTNDIGFDGAARVNLDNTRYPGLLVGLVMP